MREVRLAFVATDGQQTSLGRGVFGERTQADRASLANHWLPNQEQLQGLLALLLERPQEQQLLDDADRHRMGFVDDDDDTR